MSVKTPKKRASTKRKLVAVEDEEVIDLRDDAAESDVDVPPASAIIKFEVFIPGALNGKGDYPYTVRGLFPEVILEEMESIDSADMHRMEPVVDLLYDQLHMMF
mmetsp:Transcript_13897/g.18887  ORF Transcript_13897/g.18887 Transcript_13897/m.18887 type:complete len:104 (-) Transcript_13897:3699-4010(-)